MKRKEWKGREWKEGKEGKGKRQGGDLEKER